MADGECNPRHLTGEKPRGSRPSRRCMCSGSRPDWAATATRSPSRPRPSPASKTSSWGRSPGLPKVHLHNPVLAYEVRRRVHEVLVPGRRGPARTRSCWSSRARSPTKRSRARATGPRSGPTRRPASRSRPASGSTAWPPRPGPSWRPAPAPPTAESMPWPATRPAPWDWPITWAGAGDRWRACRSSTCPAARFSPTT